MPNREISHLTLFLRDPGGWPEYFEQSNRALMTMSLTPKVDGVLSAEWSVEVKVFCGQGWDEHNGVLCFEDRSSIGNTNWEEAGKFRGDYSNVCFAIDLSSKPPVHGNVYWGTARLYNPETNSFGNLIGTEQKVKVN